MKLRHLVALSALCCASLASIALGQGQPEPSPEAQRFTRLTGRFAGRGTTQVPGFGEVRWTARAEAKLVLGGFFVHERTEIDAGAPMPLCFEGVYGYDAATKRCVTYGVDNMGQPALWAEVVWVGNDVLVQNTTQVIDGVPKLVRATWRFDDGGYDFEVESATGSEPFGVEIAGRFDRTDDELRFTTPQPFVSGKPVPAEMRRLTAMTGSYATTGWMVLPGAGRIELTGTETIESRVGGHCVVMHQQGRAGDGPGWEGLTFATWNDHDQRYDFVWFDSNGTVSLAQSHWRDGRFLSVGLNQWLGQPMLNRSVLVLKDGRPAVIEGHSILGFGEPEHSFHMEYAPAR
ncbi:MAG: DUF1579 family protein [Planctomycetes bacterium]|nr:DUF1579 family protein [Planctomycetota bacterium]